MLYLVLYTTICFINSSIGKHVYYVIPTTGNQTCPTGQVCHRLSYFIHHDFTSYYDNITFIFLKGQHILNDTLEIHGLNSVTLKGQSQSTCDNYWSVIQSTVINGNGNRILIKTTTVYMEGLTYNKGYLLLGHDVHIQRVHIRSMSLQNTTWFVVSNHIIITDCMLDNTNCMKCQAGLYIYMPQHSAGSNVIHNVTIQGFTTSNIFCDSYSYIYDIVSNNYVAALSLHCNEPYIVVSLTDITITNNNATGISIESCSVEVGNVTISNNHSPLNGGGMWTNGKGSFISKPNTTVSFINNKAKGVGGAIYIDIMKYQSNSFSLSGFIIRNNSAESAGDNIYGGSFFSCTNPAQCTFLDVLNNCIQYDFTSFPSSYITSDPLGVCICNDSVDCSIRSQHKEIYPGQLITLSLVTVGQCGGISPGALLAQSNGIDIVLLTSNQQTLKTCKNFAYQIKPNATTSNRRNIVVSHKNVNHAVTYDQLQWSSIIVNISFLPCPYGLQNRQSNSGACECNDVVKGIGNTQCNMSLMPYPISRSGNKWLYYSHQRNCTVAYKHCPFDYCITSNVSLNLNESNLQCTYSRSGILCGQCQSGLSLMLGSNQCGHCSNYYLFLLPLFIVTGIGLMFMLLTLNLTVSVGTINGLLFYANILKLNEPVLFRDTSIPVLTQFISWLNLDLGINVCFFNGLDGYWKTWLQFTFSLTLILFIIVCCQYSGRLSRLFGNNVVSVLSTLILMAHSKLLVTIRNVFMRSHIKCNNFYWNVWSVDGNIEYLSGKHIPLFVVSLLFLILGLVYTHVIFCSQCLQQYGGKYCSSRFDPYVRLKPFIDSYTGPYKDKYRFWTGLLLIVRSIVTAVFGYTTGSLPQVNNYITVFVCVILLLFVRGKYKDKKNTILEVSFLLNLCCTSLLNAVSDHLEFNIKIYINGSSVGLSLVMFIGIVIFHIYLLVKNKYTCTKHNNGHQHDNTDQKESSNEEEMYSPARVINRRESLIFDIEI